MKRKFPFTTVIPLFAAGTIFTIIKKLPNCSMDIHHLVNLHTRIHPSPHPLTSSHCTIITYYILHLIVHNRFQQNGRFFRRTRHIPKHIPTRKPKATAHTMNVLNGIIIAERRERSEANNHVLFEIPRYLYIYNIYMSVCTCIAQDRAHLTQVLSRRPLCIWNTGCCLEHHFEESPFR